MNFENLREAIIQTKRVGIQHLYDIKPLDFIKLAELIQTKYSGMIDKSSVSVSEKIDGSSLKFGRSNGKFFAESAYVGPIFKPGGFLEYAMNKYPDNTEEKKKYPKGFDDILNIMKKHKPLQKVLAPYKDIKIQCELLYNPFGTVSDKKIRFVGISYDTSKLGEIATFIVLNIFDENGQPHENAKEIINALKSVSNKELKFEDTSITYNAVNISAEVKKFQDIIKNYSNIEYFLKSRKHADRDTKNAIKEIVLTYQMSISEKLLKGIKSGKLGPEVEGLVFKLASGESFKVVSSAFAKGKKLFDKGNK